MLVWGVKRRVTRLFTMRDGDNEFGLQPVGNVAVNNGVITGGGRGPRLTVVGARESGSARAMGSRQRQRSDGDGEGGGGSREQCYYEAGDCRWGTMSA